MKLKDNIYKAIFLIGSVILSHTFYAQNNDEVRDNKDRSEEQKKLFKESSESNQVKETNSSPSKSEENLHEDEAISATQFLELYKSSTNKEENLDKLEIAYSMEPNNPSILTEFVRYGEVNANAELKSEFVIKLASHNNFSTELIEYNKNVLRSTTPGAILITNGETDTYPSWIQQEIEKENPTVTLWNLDLLKDENYRNTQFQKVGLSTLAGTKTENEIVDHIVSSKNQGEIFFALTLNHSVLKKHSANLYLTGLALNYITFPSNNNLLTVKDNWENHFQLTVHLNKHPINRNYLLPLVNLYKIYDKVGDQEKKREIKQQIKKLAKSQNIQNPLEK